MRFLFFFLGCFALTGCASPPPPSIEPAQNAVFSSTREVRSLSWNIQTQTLWAATAGGVLRFQHGVWMKWTRADGLPANEAFEVDSDGQARFPVASARFDGAQWEASPAPPFQKIGQSAKWNGQTVRATLEGLDLGSRVEPMPSQSTGTHISAIVPLGSFLEVAVYGDGLWGYDGTKWMRDEPVPREAREITALAGDDQTLWMGTRRQGIWRRQGGHWQQFQQTGEIPSHNIQFLCQFRGVLWASTLDDGLVFRGGEAWQSVVPPEISSSAPRQLMVWRDTLWVRHGGGVVDSFDGNTWTKNALAKIPRRGVYALAGDANRLLASGWGGWAEWDGTTWAPHYDVPELKGIPLLGIAARGDEVWIATQSRGIAVWSRSTGKVRWLDERAGLPDDWVTTMGECGGHFYAGTFVGGLARLNGEKWFVFPELKGENVTSICTAPDGSVLAATREGVWKIKGDTASKVSFAWLDGENQALLSDEHGVWIGARTSLNFWRQSGLPTKERNSKSDASAPTAEQQK